MRLLSRLCLAVWLALVLLGSLLPRVPPAEAVARFPGAAYAAHAVAYAVLCCLTAWALRLGDWRRLLAAAAGASLLGLALECIQPLTGRAFDLADVAANAAGAVAGLAALMLARRALARRSPSPQRPLP